MFADNAPRCDCGYRLRSRSEEDQVAEIRRHGLEAHGIAFSIEEALVVLLRSQLESSEASPLNARKETDE
jgi:hypothetical protein